jgi:fibronectin-binding autotransporter adhesin
MRPVSSRAATLWISVLFLLAALVSFDGTASAQAAAGSKRKLSQQSRLSQHPVASMAAARRTTLNAPPPPLTADSWTGTAGDNNWGTPGNWSVGVPSSANAVTIGTATANVNLNVNGTFGTLALSNAGDVLNVANNMVLTADGNITNNGQLNMNSVGNNTELIVGASGIMFSGTGTLNMSNNTQNLIFGAAAADKLTNSSTIQGSGNIGAGQMALANSGTIDATQSNNLIIQTSNGDTNTGTLEATTGVLILQGDTITNTGGTIKSTGSAVQLNGVNINGGTLTTTGSGLIHTVSGQGATLENLTNSGSYQIDNNASTTLIGTITNSKNINLASGGNVTSLIISGNVSLAGTGTVTMSNNSQNYIYGAASGNTLTVGSGQTISGSGAIGFDPFIPGAQMTLVNHGIIDANQSNLLDIQTSGGTTNTGTLEATTGTLLLFGSTVTQTGTGNISSTGSDVQLQGGVTINGGTLKTSGTGLIHTTSGQSATLENLTNSGTYQVDNNGVTNLIGTITNNGNINLASIGNNTELVINGNVSLSGTGTVTLSNNPQNLILGSAGTNVLTVGSGQAISGAGELGDNQMTLVNNGVIDATLSTPLFIDTSNGTTNNKTLEATGGGTLILFGRAANTITNTGGTISAAASSTVDLQNGIIINGGTITTSGSGLIHTQSGQTATLENLTNAGNYQLDNNSNTILVGTITNNGNINLASGGNNTELLLIGNVTLSGTGTLTMSNNPQNFIFGSSGAGTEVLTNNINISGAGNIGDGQTIINNTSLGTINANQSNALIINPTATSSAGVSNTGLLEATTGGTLQLDSGTYINAVGSTQGTILANGGTVNLEAGATIVGGTLKTQNGGVFQNVANAATLDGSTSTGAVTVVAGSSLVVLNNTVLNVKGSIVNNGSMTLSSAGNNTELVVSSTSATLSGTGTLTMSNNPQNFIFGAVGSDTFTNKETIQGSGNIGAGQLTFVNSGTVNANQSTALEIQTSGGTTNTGILEATTGGTLVLDGSAGGNITNTGGTIQANGASGTGNGAAVNLQNGVTITGGTITSNSFGGFNVVNTATLSGLTNTGTVNITNNTALTLAGTIVNNGTINMNSVGNNTELILSGNVTLNGTGTVTMSNNPQNLIFGGVSADVLTVGSTQTIQGAGNIGNGQMALVNNGTINANVSNPLTINVSNGTTNTGTLEASAGGSLSLFGRTVTNTGAGKIVANTGGTVFLRSGVLVSGGSLTGGGTFIEDGSGGGATLSGLTNASTVLVNNNTALTLAGTINNTDSIQENSVGNVTEILISGNATLTGLGTLTLSNNPENFILGASGFGTEVFTNASTIQGSGNIGDGAMGLVNSGTINANQSNTLFIDVNTKNFNNTGTIEATAAGGLVVEGPANSFLNYSSGTNTLTGGTYIANGGNLTLPLGSSGGIATLSAKVTEEGGSLILNSNNGNANALNGLTSITSTGALTIGGVAFTDAGSFSNAGSLTILSGESFTVGSLTQISGNSLTAGTYVLDANLNLTGATQNITTNAANLTLAGGTIENANSTNALAGLATNTGKLTIGGASNNLSTTASSFSNTGTLTINGGDSFTAPKLTQISGTTLSGGTLVLGGNLDLTTTGISVTTNSSTLTLQGGTIKSGTANALSALASNTRSLTIAGTSNNVSTSAASFSNAGTLTINSGDSFTAPNLTQISSGNLTAGTYVLAGNLDLTTTGINITTNSANLTLEGGTIKSGTANALSALASNTKNLTIAGTSNNVSTTAASFGNTGTLTINSGDSFTAPALTQISGTTLTGGTYVLAGNLDLTAAANITTNSAVLALQGGSIKTGSTNDLANLSSNTNSLTLANNANISTVGNFTNSGALTVNKGSKFTVTTGTLTNLSGGTLAGGTYTIGGTLQLPTANGGITTNAANLTLTGTAAKIMNGSTNALAGFNNNTGTFALAGGGSLTTASNFSNSGTMTVAKGTTLTVGGTSHSYNQTAGTTTVDGTLSGGTSGAVNVTGGTILGGGMVTANTSVGNASGLAATLNVGDSGKSGLLAITGTYAQLATGNMTGFINGTTAGTGFSQLQVTGTAALAGTINFAVAAAFQSSLTLGETFTVLNAGSVTGTFSNSTIAINSTFHFTVTYTSTGVVLTVASGPIGTPNSSPAQPGAQIAMASAKPASAKSKTLVPVSGLRHGANGAGKSARPIVVASWPRPTGRPNALLARGPEMISGLQSWERIPVASASPARPLFVAVRAARAVNSDSSHATVPLPTSYLRMGRSQAIHVQSPIGAWMGPSSKGRVPVRILQPTLPRVTR